VTAITQNQINAVQRGVSRSPYTGLGTGSAANERYVNHLYQDLLQRPADATGLAFYGHRLDSGTPRNVVVNNVLSTQEYRVIAVQQMFQQLLGRSADPVGLASMTGLLDAGGSAEAAICVVAASAEFYADGGGTDQGFVNSLYSTLLGRPGDAATQLFCAQLRHGVSRSQIALAVLNSEEYREKMVRQLYERLLRRAAQVDAAPPVGDKDSLIALIASSDEYFALANA
jgi:hypothetical protein